MAISESGTGADTVNLIGECLIDTFRLSHVLNIQVTEPTVMTSKPVNRGLPTRVYGGKQGRTVEITGWVDNITDLNTITAFSDGNAHTVQLPTGKTVSVHIIQAQPTRQTDPYKQYPYRILAEERMD